MSELATPEAPQERLDLRQRDVIAEARFFEPYQEELHELFNVLGMDGQWSDDPRALLPHIHGWIGDEHGANGTPAFTPEQLEGAKPILARMGLVGEVRPPQGEHFDTIVVLGATRKANERRLALVLGAIDHDGVTADTIMFWAGQRPREGRDGTNDDLLEGIRENPWVQRALADGDFEPGNEWQLTETEIARLALLRLVDPDMMARRVNLVTTDAQSDDQVPATPPGVPPRLVRDLEFIGPDGQRYVILNAPAVDRGEGRPPRHTTASGAVEWLREYNPPQGAQVLFVTSNPHTLRTTQDVYRIFQEQGRGDLRLYVTGAAMPGTVPVQTALGEVARLIENDVRRNYPPVEKDAKTEALPHRTSRVLRAARRIARWIGDSIF